MKIAIDFSILTLQKYGGISTYILMLTENLIKNGVKIDAIVNSTEIVSRLPSSNSITIHYEKNYGRLHQFSRIRVPKTSSILLSPYYRIPKCSNVEYVTVLHDLTLEKLRPIRSLLHRIIKIRSLNRANKIICISNAIRKDLLNFAPTIGKKNIKVIYHGVNNEKIAINTVEDEDYVMFLGSRAFYKRFDLAIEIVRELESCKLVVIGSPLSTKEFSQLESRLSGRYVYLDNPSDKIVRTYLSQAICLLYPSEGEGFGLPILEAFNMGCPVVISSDPALVEIGSHMASIVETQNTASYVSVIDKLRLKGSSSKAKKEMANYANNFTWEKTALKTLMFINE
jgi:mannosyltransferase